MAIIYYKDDHDFSILNDKYFNFKIKFRPGYLTSYNKQVLQADSEKILQIQIVADQLYGKMTNS